MAPEPSHDVTQLLVAWNKGDESALEQLIPLVQAELHRLAARYIGRERPGHLLQPTALVNEAYMRLIDWRRVEWRNRAHFFGVSAQMMRRILVDFARKRRRLEDRTAPDVSLDDTVAVGAGRGATLVAVDDALNGLAAIDQRKSRIVEMRFFGGLSNDEIAEVLQISTITVIREWNKAKVWLYRELSRQP